MNDAPAICPKCGEIAEICYDPDVWGNNAKISWSVAEPYELFVEFECKECETVFEEIYKRTDTKIVSTVEKEEDIT